MFYRIDQGGTKKRDSDETNQRTNPEMSTNGVVNETVRTELVKTIKKNEDLYREIVEVKAERDILTEDKDKTIADLTAEQLYINKKMANLTADLRYREEQIAELKTDLHYKEKELHTSQQTWITKIKSQVSQVNLIIEMGDKFQQCRAHWYVVVQLSLMKLKELMSISRIF
ncbi:cilia- and flagella-associated protein 44-like [Ptychodera flava]|uniref:cilia- and flagella-associated protein 44-like n=1 Tax=Ptychodera flava TaxID=63121 RepID=UPI00396A6A52